jgi:2-phosphosulfolactate phosphatase
VNRGGWQVQDGYDVRFEWGAAGTVALAGRTEIVVVVDVLRFTTAVEAAVSQGAVVFPYRWLDDTAATFASSVGASLADGSEPSGPSLSPLRLGRLGTGDSVVLPSPNGSTCAVLAADAGARVVASCLRNASAVAEWVNGAERPVAVIACGEHWPDGSLRPCAEDLLGAGALMSRLRGSRSPEAQTAVGAWAAAGDLAGLLGSCASGRELEARGHSADVAYAGAFDVSAVVPLLSRGRFVSAPGVDIGQPG